MTRLRAVSRSAGEAVRLPIAASMGAGFLTKPLPASSGRGPTRRPPDGSLSYPRHGSDARPCGRGKRLSWRAALRLALHPASQPDGSGLPPARTQTRAAMLLPRQPGESSIQGRLRRWAPRAQIRWPGQIGRPAKAERSLTCCPFFRPATCCPPFFVPRGTSYMGPALCGSRAGVRFGSFRCRRRYSSSPRAQPSFTAARKSLSRPCATAPRNPAIKS